jgi:hypothetical protein
LIKDIVWICDPHTTLQLSGFFDGSAACTILSSDHLRYRVLPDMESGEKRRWHELRKLHIQTVMETPALSGGENASSLQAMS